MQKVLYVSVKKSFHPEFTLNQLAPWVERAWAKLTPAKAQECDRVIAVYEGSPVAAWRVRGAFYVDETWGDGYPRVALSLGDPLPILDAYYSPPMLRSGWAVRPHPDVDPLPPERSPEWFEEPDGD